MKSKDKRLKNFIKILIVVFAASLFSNAKIEKTEAATIKMSQETLTLNKGSTKTLTLKNVPKKATVTWSTSNYFAATVTKDGTVQALNYGVATIRATYKKKTYACVVTIPDASRRVTLNIAKVSLTEGDTLQLTATAQKKISFMSMNSDIASVNERGLVKAENPGTTAIVAKTKSGYASCYVTVTSADTTQKNISKSKTAIRRYSKKNKPVYDYICWAKGKDIRFVLANIDESTVKKIHWKTDDKKILSKPVKEKGSRIVVQAQALQAGKTKIIAKVAFKNGKAKEYATTVRVTDPQINTKEVNVYKPMTSGVQWQQYVSFEGISKYSNVTWGDYNSKIVSCNTYQTKRSFAALKAGKGVMKVTVDGKSFKVRYNSYIPTIKRPAAVLKKGASKKITISGISGLAPQYLPRNKSFVTIAEDGTMTTKKAGVTYVDIQLGNVVYTFRQEVAAKGMKTIIKRATYIVNNWTYSQAKRLFDGYYDCSALVWKGYKAYNNYQKKLSNIDWPLSAGAMFDYLESKGQIKTYGYVGMDSMKPGDLIFYGDYDNAVRYSTPGRTLNIYHVAMYAGNGNVVEKGGKTLNYNGTRYIVGIGRVVN